jgi:urease accessory protein
MTPLLAGLLHPLLVPAHVLAIAALGLLIGQQGWGRGAPMAYIIALLGGLGAISLAYVPARAEEGLLAATAIAGLLVALARPLPWMIGVLLAAAIGLSIALDSPPEAISLRDANLTLLGTGLGATLALVVLAQGAAHLRPDWQRVAARIMGSWIAASAILVLALRFAR